MSEKLLNCPICQNKTQWCDFDGEKISGECCDNIECKSCGLLFQFDDRSEHGRDTLQEIQSDNAKAFNKRTLPQEVQDVIGLLRVAVCPNCDGSGCLAVPVMRHTGETDNMGWPLGIIDCEPEQCQWCDEKEQILKKYEEANDAA